MAQNVIDADIKVLIVDDEQLVRQGLRMTVDWSKHQMAVVADSPNGILGWEAFLQYRPDVVITDIVMPEMDGIELAQKIRSASPDTKLLFLSCHRDFAFAKQGIQLGISDYIVKTNFDDEQMDQCLDKIRKELMQRRLNSSLNREHPSGQKGDPGSLLQAWLKENKPAAVVQLRQMLDGEWNWAVSGGHLFHLFINGADEEHSALLEPLIQAASLEFDDKLLCLKSGQDSFYALCGNIQLEAFKSRLLALKLNHPQLEWRSEENLQDSAGWLEAAHKMHRLREIELQTGLYSTAHKEDVLQAIDFIDRHLHLDIRAAGLAKEIGVSRSYFSTLFKEATGCSLIGFISDRKLNRAKELLRLTNLRTEEIAEQVGIQDVKYFSKWFKKSVAQTPSQYRYQTK